MIPVHILLVEDNRGDAAMMIRRLGSATRLKCGIETAEWLSTALTFLRNKKVDIILLDLSLPDSHGIDTVLAVRREAPNTPIIVLSGQEDLNIATRTMEAGADNFIVKRLDLSGEELEREILYSLERSRRAATSRELVAKSLKRLTPVDKPDSVPPDPLVCMATEHVDRVDDSVAEIRAFLHKNNPGLAEQVEQILSKRGYHVAMQELRSLLGMDYRHGQKTTRISDLAMKAVRELSTKGSIVDPEQELLDVLSDLGD